ncbi:MAG: hypothetical protein E7I63_18400 [Citrobacter koseri]|uniref:hypothetical protein n=2 Tax=Enterobacteriaceae TaxID=543 RepID=UPI0013791BB8|nr:hypothetical protein [Citrobacter koseri]MDU4402714.1 hypothetical protein [Citrobacter koseri]HAT7525409.1 hypothetical protein [Citrobacter koseri]HBD7023501.1 hypothetical protein [Citrobacter koseri]HEI8998551.1 hypothetical protein [Citrobacter koseri]
MQKIIREQMSAIMLRISILLTSMFSFVVNASISIQCSYPDSIAALKVHELITSLETNPNEIRNFCIQRNDDGRYVELRLIDIASGISFGKHAYPACDMNTETFTPWNPSLAEITQMYDWDTVLMSLVVRAFTYDAEDNTELKHIGQTILESRQTSTVAIISPQNQNLKETWWELTSIGTVEGDGDGLISIEKIEGDDLEWYLNDQPIVSAGGKNTTEGGGGELKYGYISKPGVDGASSTYKLTLDCP